MFNRQSIPFEETLSFAKIVSDYTSQKLDHSFFEFDYSLESFSKIIANRSFNDAKRNTLFTVLKKQYGDLLYEDTSKPVAENVDLLLQSSTFTVTTGHQLNVLTGPLYFVYKILTTIKLSKALKEKFPNYNFVPLYWMATEDHDFEEIKSVNIFSKKLTWQHESVIATGRIKTENIESFVDEVIEIFGNSFPNALQITSLIKDSYLKNKTLADATRYMVHQLFCKYGLVILDADEANFKKQFINVISDDVFYQPTKSIVDETNKQLQQHYGVQVNPRDINFFYLTESYRERIVHSKEGFVINNRNEKFSSDEMKLEIEKHPERFSPNVLLRPLYQETILPNLAYIGGPAEVHYWLQLKDLFKHYNINYPMIVMRNSFMILEDDTIKRMKKNGIKTEQIFEPVDSIIAGVIRVGAGSSVNLDNEAAKLSEVFNLILQKVATIDETLKSTVEAEKQKVLNAIKNLESKMLKAEKQKNDVAVNQIVKLKEKLFPGKVLQERSENIFPYLLKYGFEFIDMLLANSEPLPSSFLILKSNNPVK